MTDVLIAVFNGITALIDGWIDGRKAFKDGRSPASSLSVHVAGQCVRSTAMYHG